MPKAPTKPSQPDPLRAAPKPAPRGSGAAPKPDLETGLVIRREGVYLQVLIGAREVPCRVRGRVRRDAGKVSSAAVIGDRVRVSRHSGGDSHSGEDAMSEGVIEEVLPRSSVLSRPGFRGMQNIIAANVDLLVVVQAAGEPPFSVGMAERFQVLAREGGMEALMVLNKCELQPRDVLREWLAPLAPSGLRTLLTSAATGEGIDALRSELSGRVSVLAGKSGVGKSSLINALYPGFNARTGAVSAALNKGQHTTTAGCLYPLPGGGYLADTPGIRTLGLFADTADESILATFPEIEAAAFDCRFRDCSHTHEPGCAVIGAVDSGQIRGERLEQYHRITTRA
jgi:ribosome biogenesis GTPase